MVIIPFTYKYLFTKWYIIDINSIYTTYLLVDHHLWSMVYHIGMDGILPWWYSIDDKWVEMVYPASRRPPLFPKEHHGPLEAMAFGID